MKSSRWWRRAFVVGAAICALAFALAACGGSESTPSTEEPASTESPATTDQATSPAESAPAESAADSAAVESTSAGSSDATQSALVDPPTEEELAAYLDGVFGPGSGLTLGDVPRVAQDAFAIAAQEITPEEKELLSTCLAASECETGRGELTIAIAETFGANPWRQQFRAVATLQLLRYPQVSTIVYTDGGADLQKVLSNFRSLVAQGVDGIVGVFDFGPAMEQVLKQATETGIVVVSHSQAISTAIGKVDGYTDVNIDACEQGRVSGELAAQVKPGGTIAMYTGTPGNPFAAEWEPCAEEAIAAGGATITTNGTTNWSPQGEQQAAAALVAKGLPDAIIYDYLPNAFWTKIQDAGETPPAQIGGSMSFGSYKMWSDFQDAGQTFPAYAVQSQLGYGNVSVSVLIEKILGEGADIEARVLLPATIFSTDLLGAYYDPSVPEGANFNTGLPADVLKEALSASS